MRWGHRHRRSRKLPLKSRRAQGKWEHKRPLYDLHAQKDRIYVEGRLALNYLYLGFDINNGDGGDDLRVIGGLTFDIQQLFRRK
jgi:hypothetical protein